MKTGNIRFPFVYGDGNGHLEELPKHLISAKWHPAMGMSTVHHQDIIYSYVISPYGTMDGRIVNISDDAPTSFYESIKIVAEKMEPSSEPLNNPWHLHIDGSLVRCLGCDVCIIFIF